MKEISNNFKMELLKIPYAMIQKKIKDYPQNNNIFLPKENYVKIYQRIKINNKELVKM